ncbi:alpha/beta hydrolase [Streptomyces sp. NPDC051907]|uniref:alpha/beta hydrolase family protein n=1 Tax=Streptomyces sp. NPDC051907 TaxID=3155284 RepID=UPI0034471FF4
MSRRTFARSAALAGATLVAGGAAVAHAGPAHAEPAHVRPAGARKTAARKAAARKAAGFTPTLPAPTGPHPVGHTTLHLVDDSRRDPWDSAIPVRELMVTVFYPARAVRGYPVATQMTAGAAKAFGEFVPLYVHQELPKSGVNWAATSTHSYTGAPAQPVRRPVLLYSPGGGEPRTLGTGLAEELASRGYAVVAVDHPGDATEVEFPDGRVRAIELRPEPGQEAQQFRKMVDTRLADLRFVLDQLKTLAAGGNPDAGGRTLPKDLERALDLRRVGAYGHSAGGTAVAQAMYEDRRIDAAVNLEGYLDYPAPSPGRPGELFPVARDGVDRPLLLLGTDGFRDERFDRSWSAMLAHPRGCTRWRQIDDAMHYVFTDYAAIAPQLQDAGLMTADGRVQLVGPIAPAQSTPLVRRRVLSFFAEHLPVR